MAKFKPKDRVYAKYEDDGKWYPAKVLSVTGKKVKVKYIADDVIQVTDIDDVSLEKPSHKPKQKEVEKPAKKKHVETDDSLDDLDSEIDEDSSKKKKKKEEEEEEEEPEEEKEEEKEEESALSEMTRAELKEHIADNDLDIKVTKDMDDDDIRAAIEEAEGSKEESEPEQEEEVEEEEEKPRKKKKDEEEEESDDDDEKPKGKWFSEGDEDDASYQSERRTFRFWIPQGKKTEITIITPKPLTFREHRVKINGRWEPFTCIATTGERCPLCENKNRAGLAKAFYIIDHSEYENKKGEQVKDQMRLMVMPATSYQVLKETAEEYFDGQDEWTYAGLTMVVRRTNKDKSPGTGDIFIIKKKTKIDPELKTKASFEALQTDTAPLSRKVLATKVHFIEDDSEKE